MNANINLTDIFISELRTASANGGNLEGQIAVALASPRLAQARTAFDAVLAAEAAVAALGLPVRTGRGRPAGSKNKVKTTTETPAGPVAVPPASPEVSAAPPAEKPKKTARA